MMLYTHFRYTQFAAVKQQLMPWKHKPLTSIDTDVQHAATADAIMRKTHPNTLLLYIRRYNIYSDPSMRTFVRLLRTLEVATSRRCRASELEAIIDEKIRAIGIHKVTMENVRRGVLPGLRRWTRLT